MAAFAAAASAAAAFAAAAFAFAAAFTFAAAFAFVAAAAVAAAFAVTFFTAFFGAFGDAFAACAAFGAFADFGAFGAFESRSASSLLRACKSSASNADTPTAVAAVFWRRELRDPAAAAALRLGGMARPAEGETFAAAAADDTLVLPLIYYVKGYLVIFSILRVPRSSFEVAGRRGLFRGAQHTGRGSARPLSEKEPNQAGVGARLNLVGLRRRPTRRPLHWPARTKSKK
jgi:hypothetical protein